MRDTKVLKNRNATLFILEGLAMATAMNMLGPFVSKFTERMGGNNWHIALVNSLPPLVAIIILVPFGIIFNRIRNKKAVATFLLLFNSLFFLVMVLVPGLPANIRATVFVVVVGIMNWPQSLYLTTWQTFYSDTFRGKIASAIYGIRARYVSLAGVLVVLITGIVFSGASSSNASAEFIYQIIFVRCFVFTVLQAILLSKVETRRHGNVLQNKETFKVLALKTALSDKKFMIFCGSVFVFYFAWQMCWPIFFIYNSSKEFVGLDELWFGIMAFGSGIASFIMYPFWTKKLLKWGTGPVMIIGASSLAINPFLFTFSTNAYWILAVNCLVGAIIPAFTLALFCRTVELAPDKGKIVYFAVFNTITNISGFMAPLAGVWVKMNIGVIHTFWVSGAARFVGLIALVLSVYFSRTKLKHYTRRILKLFELPKGFGNG